MLIGIVAVLAALSAAGTCLAGGGFGGLNWLWQLPLEFVGWFACWGIVAFLVLWISCMTVDTSKPQTEDSKYFRFLAKLYPKAICTLTRCRVHKQGMEQLPQSGRYLLVCNHLNNMDPVVLLAEFPNSQLAFITKRENSTMFIVGKVMHRILCQNINRENDREALTTILNCIKLIKEDKVSVGVFPEGYTSKSGLLQPFRSGVFKIAQKANVPIVVCTLQNTQYVFDNAKKLKPTDVELHLVGVVPAEELQGVTATAIGDRVHGMMEADLGPELAPPVEK